MTPEEIAAQKASDDAKNEVPAWAQTLIDTTTDFNTRLSAFEEKLAPPVVEEPKTEPQHQEPWTPQSWGDVDERAKELAASEAQRILDERDQAAKSANDAQTAAANEIDQMLDAQVAELTTASKLPAITNENDPNDPGKLAQRELYGFALSLGTADLKTSFNVLDNLHKAGKTFDFVKMELVDKNPASMGANSPVGSSSSGAAGAQPSRPDYKTLYGASLDQLAARFGA